jgi:tetratricopeptide (TPR) repeat protein
MCSNVCLPPPASRRSRRSWTTRCGQSARKRAFDAALAEYVAVQTGDSDLPGGRFNLALVRASQGQPEAAVAQYRAAIRVDPHFLPAYANLAMLYNQLGRNAEAERVLRDGIAQEPEEGELYYSLGLLLAEDQRLEDAVSMLEKAATLLPERPRVLYNHALALQHLGRRGDAERALRAAHALDDSDRAIVHALAIFYLQQRHWDDALVYARALVALAPGEPEPEALVRQIESMRIAGGAPAGGGGHVPAR